MTDTLDGVKVVKARTINSMYANGYIEVQTSKGEWCRIHVDVILSMMPHFTFIADTPGADRRRKHIRLDMAIPKEV